MKLYNENEIGAILKRAAELSHDDINTSSVGLSVEELQQLGAEAGLNPDFVLRAAAELQNAKPPRSKNFFGGPVSYEKGIVLDGEMTEVDWEEMIASIRSTFKYSGVVSKRANTYEWMTKWELGNAQVTARLVKGQTRVSVFWAEPALAIPFFIPTLIGTILAFPILEAGLELSAATGIPTLIAIAASLFFAGRWGVSSYTDRFTEKLERMVTSFELIAPKGEPAPSGEARAALPEQQAEQLLEFDEPEVIAVPGRTRDRA